MQTRIQKIISDSGYCSRRKAEELIASGQVRVNGQTVAVGDKADPDRDKITISGEPISLKSVSLRYIKMYKPRGYLVSMNDVHSDKLITDLLKDIPERIYPIGRLDKNSEGIILLTNDGAFANDIMHPRKHIEKVYRVTIPSAVTPIQLAQMSAGIDIDEGVVTQPCTVNVLVEEKDRTVLEIIITEGKNRQIRKMCAAVGLDVSRLKRTSVGGVKLGMLKPGEYRDLTSTEMRILRAKIGKGDKAEGRVKK